MALFDSAVASMDSVQLATFGDTVTFTPRGGVGYALTCIVSSGEPVQQGERVYKTLWAPLANFTGGEPRKGDTVVITGVTYRAGEPETNHFGGRKLPLSVTTP